MFVRTRGAGRRVASSVALLAALPVSIAHAADLPSFPGAEGFGAIATGGRGGQVIKVTTLASNGPGSLQAALSTPGPRIVVFEVSGVIEGDVTVEEGDVTIAGQTAPGAGITIAGRFFGAYTTSVNNIVVRHIRVRAGAGTGAGNLFDALQFSRNSRLMFDHMSVAWGIDENMDLYEARDVTVQWSTIEESATSGHPEGVHAYGLINGPDGARISVHHNLFAHHKARCPAIANGPAEVSNNVMYNVRHGFVHHNEATGAFNLTGNVFIQGPDNSLIPFWFDGGSGNNGRSYHLADNLVDDPGDYVGLVDNPWQTPLLHPSFGDMAASGSFYTASEHDFSDQVGHVAVGTQDAVTTEDLVAGKAGAFPRDVVSQRTLDELAERGGSWGVDRPSSLMQGLTATAPPADEDDDGMADTWEAAHGLDATDGSDHDTIMESGYTAIEEYINELAAQLVGESPGSGGTGAGGSGGDGGAGNGGDETTGAGGDGPIPSPNQSEGDGGGDTSGQPGAGNPGTAASPGQADGGCAFHPAPSPSGVAWLMGVLGAALLGVRRRAWERRSRTASRASTNATTCTRSR